MTSSFALRAISEEMIVVILPRDGLSVKAFERKLTSFPQKSLLYWYGFLMIGNNSRVCCNWIGFGLGTAGLMCDDTWRTVQMKT